MLFSWCSSGCDEHNGCNFYSNWHVLCSSLWLILNFWFTLHTVKSFYIVMHWLALDMSKLWVHNEYVSMPELYFTFICSNDFGFFGTLVGKILSNCVQVHLSSAESHITGVTHVSCIWVIGKECHLQFYYQSDFPSRHLKLCSFSGHSMRLRVLLHCRLP